MFITDRKTMCDAEAIADREGISYYTLMESAGKAAAKYIYENTNLKNKNALLICGNGNNGGDGFIIARELSEMGVKTFITLPLGEPRTHCAKKAFDTLPEGVDVISFDNMWRSANKEEGDPRYDIYDSVFIDAVYGTGFRGELPDEVSKVFGLIDRIDFAIDIPSGIVCDSGVVSEHTLKAECTLSFAALKICHVIPPSADYCGKVVCLDIGIKEEYLERAGAKITAVRPYPIGEREKSAHKNSQGVLLAVTGSYGMPGAAIISGKAALRSGVGILKLACIEENYTACAVNLPEAVLIPLKRKGKTFSAEGLDILKRELKTADALLIGCGLGISEDTKKIVKELLKTAEIPVVLDADGINLIANDIEFLKDVKAPLILTPHPGEMARITGLTPKEVEADRLGLAESFAEKHSLTLVLKGANTIIAHDRHGLKVNIIGNAGMATAGSGDMLAGIAATMLSKGLTAPMAAEQAVYIHSAAGDIARKELGENFMLPTDMIERMHKVTYYDKFFGVEFKPLP